MKKIGEALSLIWFSDERETFKNNTKNEWRLRRRDGDGGCRSMQVFDVNVEIPAHEFNKVTMENQNMNSSHERNIIQVVNCLWIDWESGHCVYASRACCLRRLLFFFLESCNTGNKFHWAMVNGNVLYSHGSSTPSLSLSLSLLAVFSYLCVLYFNDEKCLA